MTDTIRWGILGPGSIAHKFAKGLAVIDDAELAAIGSRSLERANTFADAYGADARYGSYEELANDKNVDVIYVATPHPFHREHTLLCLEAGKAVLCEKPISINAQTTKEMVVAAQEKKLFLMEAMWTRFLPTLEKARQWIADGRIGEVRLVKADFGFRVGWNPESRLLDPNLGGGSLLDVGVYTISLANMIFGSAPNQVTGAAHLGDTGVDEQAGMVLGYPGGGLAVLCSAVRTSTPQEAHIIGTEGSIHIPDFWHSTTASLMVANEVVDQIDAPFQGSGYEYEAMEVHRCLRAGELESPVMPLQESIEVMEAADRLRGQWGFALPMERGMR